MKYTQALITVLLRPLFVYGRGQQLSASLVCRCFREARCCLTKRSAATASLKGRSAAGARYWHCKSPPSPFPITSSRRLHVALKITARDCTDHL